MKEYRTAAHSSETEEIINKSRFISRCFPVESEDEALKILADIKKRHWDASHSCYAYRIGESASVARYGDDGEPSGTAGMPIMDVLVKRDLTDTLIVVTRYFGGVLLGAGGLVRAYSGGAAAAAAAAGTVLVKPGVRMELTISYPRYEALMAVLRGRAEVERSDFGSEVTVAVMVEADSADALIAAAVSATDGRVQTQKTGEGRLRLTQ